MEGYSIRYFIWGILLVGLFTFCERRQLSPEGYTKWMTNPSNGLIKAKEVDGIEYRGFYKPVEYMALLESKYEEITEPRINNLLSEFEGFHYFTFTMKAKDWNQEFLRYRLQNADEYNYRIQYYSFAMQDDFLLINGQDTVDCSIFHCERVYGVSPELKVVLGFEANTDKADSDLTLKYFDRVFNNGFINLSFSHKTLAKLPKLTIL